MEARQALGGAGAGRRRRRGCGGPGGGHRPGGAGPPRHDGRHRHAEPGSAARRCPAQVSSAVLAVLRESLTNIMRHAPDAPIMVSARAAADATGPDGGQRAGQAARRQRAGGMGLAGMRSQGRRRRRGADRPDPRRPVGRCSCRCQLRRHRVAGSATADDRRTAMTTEPITDRTAIRVVLADDQRVVREGLVLMLGSDGRDRGRRCGCGRRGGRRPGATRAARCPAGGPADARHRRRGGDQTGSGAAGSARCCGADDAWRTNRRSSPPCRPARSGI